MTNNYSAKHYAIKSQKWAVGTQEDCPNGSAKHWAEIAGETAASIGNPANRDLSNLTDVGLLKFDAKQDVLTPGENIKISADNIISASPGSSKCIGEIIKSAVPLSDAGLHLLDGAVLSADGIYADFVSYMSLFWGTHPDLFTTEANWQSAVTKDGYCRLFVFDETNQTIRLPKMGFKDVLSVTNAKVISADGADSNLLFVQSSGQKYSFGNASGGTSGLVRSYPEQLTGQRFYSNMVADLSGIVLDESYFYYICVGEIAKSAQQINFDNVATELNNKADVNLSNVSGTIDFIIHTWQSSDGLTWYREYKSGWIEQGGTGTSETLTFPLAFENTNYTLIALPIRMNASVGSNDMNYYAKSTTTVQMQLRFNGAGQSGFSYMWYACGMKGV